MLQKQTIFHGYRGTNKYWGNKCKNENTYKFSKGKDEYFGHGIYFFENDEKEAYNWAKYSRKYDSSDICVIYAFIETDKVLDFFETDTFNDYILMIEGIIEKYKNSSIEIIPIFNKPYDCNLINLICKEENLKLIRGPYEPNHRSGNQLFNDGYTRIKRTHIQLCVKDIGIIKSFETKFYDE